MDDNMVLKTALVVVSILAIVVGITLLVLAMEKPKEVHVRFINPTVTGASSQTITIPHKDYEKEIKELKTEISKLKTTIENQKKTNYYSDKYRIYTYRGYRVFHFGDYDYDHYKYRKYDRDHYYYWYKDDEHDLTVYVYDEDHDEVEDARVEVENGDDKTKYTNHDGVAKFNNLEEDCYDMKIKADGFKNYYYDFCLRDDKRIRVYLDED